MGKFPLRTRRATRPARPARPSPAPEEQKSKQAQKSAGSKTRSVKEARDVVIPAPKTGHDSRNCPQQRGILVPRDMNVVEDQSIPKPP
ncbi:MAG: hypothetical protein BJ554DRAFT_1967 [Olpidium bornovanus]|uniref:Uncharacterized protein n=1 Tax=Olpidium bornovanus TaxID=278681 RepID=A0A8H8DHA1_9FUNG|nr:MAG: hypothetical protein BJ554DRAFT_1967 [Olpidium bornovanus]